jgi:hypothetical protein
LARNRSGSAPRGESAFDPNPDLTFDANLVADDIGGALLALGSLMRGDIVGPTGREMDWESDTAKEYRNRAEELRAIAERMTDKESRKL